MSVNKPVQPSYGPDSGSVYPTNIDKEISVAKVIVDDFAPYAADTPDMTVKLAAGKIIKADGTLVEQAEQTTAAITAPASNPRIDRVVIDSVTGGYSVITGTEAASPTAPAITAGKLPVAQIALTTSTTAITNSLITDERTHLVQPKADNIGGGTLPSGVAVPLGNLSASAANSGYPQSGTGGETLRIIRGGVSTGGTKSEGDGFTCSNTSAGNYSITFSTAFSGMPSVVASAITGSGTKVVHTNGSTTGILIEIRDDTNTLSNAQFDFIAIGPA